MSDGILIATADGSALLAAYTNDRALSLLGLDRESCLGHDLIPLLQPGSAKGRLTSPLVTSIERREACTVRLPPRSPDAGLGCRLTLVPFDASAQSHLWLLVLHDPLRATVGQREDGHEATEGARIDTIIDLVSHQLRAPLNSALTWASLLEIDRSPKTVDRAVDVIRKSIHEQARLIDDLIDVSRVGRRSIPLDTEPLDLLSWLDETLTPLRAGLPANVSIEYSTTVASASVNANEPQLLRVVRHLVDNATKFMPEGGTIALELRIDDGSAIIDVTDQGVGLTAEELGHVFEPFWRARQKARGGGLGLGVVQAIVARHGGAVSARSPGADRGATLTVSLPLRG